MSTYGEGYQKGQILGFSMAEVIILLFFSLALLLSSLMLNKDKVLEKVEADLQAEKKQVLVLQEKLESYKKLQALIKDDNLEETFQELILAEKKAQKRIEELEKNLEDAFQELVLAEEKTEKRIEELQQKQLALQEAQEVLANEGFDILDSKDREELSATLGALEELHIKPNEIVTLVEKAKELDKLQQAFNNLKGQTQTLKNKLDALGKGTEAVPCWASLEGKPEYIFDVTVHSNGFSVHNNQLPHRAQEQTQLPLTQISYDTEISSQNFQNAFLPLLDWSKENQCRFFVRTYDKTGAAEKSEYKEQMRRLGSRFYYYEAR